MMMVMTVMTVVECMSITYATGVEAGQPMIGKAELGYTTPVGVGGVWLKGTGSYIKYACSDCNWVFCACLLR